MRISIRDGSSLVRPMSNVRISYCALNSMILSKIADRWPESIRCPAASIVSLAAMVGHSIGTVRAVALPMARRAVVRLGIPALIVAVLAIVALWRVGPPPQKADAAIATTGTSPAKAITEPVKTIAEAISTNAVGREASLEDVRIRERVGDRFYWIGSGDERPV